MLNSKLITEFKPVINTVLPLIISLDVQLQYSGFGRITKGHKKRNFSKTRTFNILKGKSIFKKLGKCVLGLTISACQYFNTSCYRNGTTKI